MVGSDRGASSRVATARMAPSRALAWPSGREQKELPREYTRPPSFGFWISRVFRVSNFEFRILSSRILHRPKPLRKRGIRSTHPSAPPPKPLIPHEEGEGQTAPPRKRNSTAVLKVEG